MVDLKKQAPTIALLFTLLVFLSYSVSWVRLTIGTAMDVVLGPLIDPEGFAVPFFVMIIILSSLTGLYSSLVQKYTIDYEKMQETQAKMRVFQKEFREAQLSGDEKRIKKLQKKQEQMMQDQLEISRQQFVPMAIILLLTVPIFFWPGVEDIDGPTLSSTVTADAPPGRSPRFAQVRVWPLTDGAGPLVVPT